MTQWIPRIGWNSVFSEEERQKGSDLFKQIMTHTKDQSFLPLSEANAEAVVMMKMYQEKYPGLRYSEDQERILHQYLRSVPSKICSTLPFALRPHAAPFIPQSQRTVHISLSIHREQHERQHRHKKENRLNDHSRHGEHSIGQKGDCGPKDALKHSRRFGVCK